MTLTKQVAELTKRIEELESDNQATGDLINEHIFNKKKKDPNVVYLEEGDKYWYIGNYGNIDWVTWGDRESDNLGLSIGNAYASKEDTQAVVDLKKDIYRFGMPKEGERILELCGCSNDELEFYQDHHAQGSVFTWTDYNSGQLMPYNATFADQSHRIKLLERVAQNKQIKLKN